MTNPETREEFNAFVAIKGEKGLSDQQLARHDSLIADAMVASQLEMIKRAAQVTKVDLGETGMQLKEGFHTKRNEPVWTVQLEERVAGDQFKELAQKARMLGGNYSSWGAKEDHGFQFRKKDDAEKFMALRTGDVSNLDRKLGRLEDGRQAAAERLSGNAERLTAAAEGSLSQDRQVNTARRAEHAASAERRARAELQMAETMERIAGGISDGSLKYLAGVKHGTHVALLSQVLRGAKWEGSRAANEPWEKCAERETTEADIRYARYPHPRFMGDLLGNVAEAIKDKPGYKQLGSRLEKRYHAYLGEAKKSPEGYREHQLVTITSQQEIDDLREACRGMGRSGLCDRVKSEVADFDRMQAMGVANLPQMRAALREFLGVQGERREADPLVTMERSLAGSKIPGFFPTPAPLVDQMLSEASIQPGHRVLEPNGGKGDIADAIRTRHPDAVLEVVEIHAGLRGLLQGKGHTVVAADFLAHAAKYDRIVMNPPFEDGSDITHVRKAYDSLEPGGRVVAIMSEGPFFRDDRAATEFRSWLATVGGRSERNPDGSFNGSDSFRKTGVSTRTVVIDQHAS